MSYHPFSALSSLAAQQEAESSRAFRHLTSTAFGTVIALRPRTEKLFNNQPMTFCYPVVQFETGRGEAIQVQSTQGCIPGSLRVGDTITVYYDATRPTVASIEKNSLF